MGRQPGVGDAQNDPESLLNKRKSGEPRRAALSQVSAGNRLTGSTAQDNWQQQVVRYDRDGPGVLGYYLDMVATLASLCPLVVQVRDHRGVWSTTDDPVLSAALTGYRSVLADQHELVSMHVRHREALGEAWLMHVDDLGWSVATVPNVQAMSDGSVRFTDMYGKQRKVPADRVWKSWVADPYEPWRPTSPVRRALPELRRLKAATRNQTRAAESRLTTNGLIAFKPDQDGVRPLLSADDALPINATEQIVNDFVALAKESFADDDSPAAWVPFPYVGEPATPISLGRGIDEVAISVERRAIEAFARAVNFPAQLLVSGPGSANHWNEWVLQEVQHKTGLAPKLIPVCADISSVYLRPVVAKLKQRIRSWDVPPDRVRVWFDLSFIAKQPDVTGAMLEAWRLGIATRDEVAERLGLKSVMEVPSGVTEYEHWVAATTGGRVDPHVPSENRRTPPSPRVAALGGVNLEDLPDRLAAVDGRVHAALSASAVAALDALVLELVREGLKKLPAGSQERARLRGLPPWRAWRELPVDAKNQVDVDSVTRRVMERHRSTVEEVLTSAVDEVNELLAEVGVEPAEFFVEAAVAAFVAVLVGFLFDEQRDTPTGWDVGLFTARVVMTVAAGAAVGVDGLPVRSPGGTPDTRDGTPWTGSGMASGHGVVRAVARRAETAGLRLRFRWVHSFYGRPETPFPPHLALNGDVFDSPADVPGGWFPGDHPYCRCELVWTFDVGRR